LVTQAVVIAGGIKDDSRSRIVAAPREKGALFVIVILVPHKNPPSVFEATREAIIVMAADVSAATTHTSSIPPGMLAGDFETSWGVLTKDLRSAERFDHIDQAIAHYQRFPKGLTIQVNAHIMTALRRIKNSSLERHNIVQDC
jgi:hypothetical protein